MNKKELICAISQEIDRIVSQDKIQLILDKAVEITKRTLEAGESVKWTGFGSLSIKEILPKKLYSPMLEKHIVSKGSRKIVFKESGKNKRPMSD